jgi:dTDP-4-dehydrorhamnose 3,5-epimerase
VIEGVFVKQLKVLPDDRGRLMEILRCDDPVFRQFGQVYITTSYPGVVKAWHFHRKQTDNVCCLKGMVRIALSDGREGSPTQGEINEFYAGEYNPVLVTIPPGVYHGWKCISEGEAMVLNIPTEPYQPGEPDEFRLPPDTPLIPYEWPLTPGRKHG